jgi:cytoskeleton protein RodZ
MQTIGERLEEARKRKGISIREAAEQTKIRGDYLQKFEANSFDIDLPPLYIRGFVRTYARYLELDPERVVSDVDAVLAREGKPARREGREALGRVDFGAAEPRNEEAAANAAESRAARDKAMLMKIGLLVGGALIAITVIILLINVLFTGKPAKPSEQAATPPATVVQSDPAQTLVLTAIDEVRIKVVRDLDKTELFQGTLGKGQSKSFKKQGKLLVTVTPGRNLRMEVNGRNYMVPIDGYGQFAID